LAPGYQSAFYCTLNTHYRIISYRTRSWPWLHHWLH